VEKEVVALAMLEESKKMTQKVPANLHSVALLEEQKEKVVMNI